MIAVLVHGVPETSSLWAPMVEHLACQQVVSLELPGFGSALPDGFDPTMETYAEWLRSELDAIDEPLHLIAHDWGALLSLRVLADRPAVVASYVLDAGNLDDDFVWHDMAQLWQTAGAGEEFMEGLLGSSMEDRAALLMASGVPESGAAEMASRVDETMAGAILSLYRSAVDIGSQWGPGIDRINGRGLLIEAEQDAFRSAGSTSRLAERSGAEVLTLPDCGHWWMLDDPGGVASHINKFWS